MNRNRIGQNQKNNERLNSFFNNLLVRVISGLLILILGLFISPSGLPILLIFTNSLYKLFLSSLYIPVYFICIGVIITFIGISSFLFTFREKRANKNALKQLENRAPKILQNYLSLFASLSKLGIDSSNKNILEALEALDKYIISCSQQENKYGLDKLRGIRRTISNSLPEDFQLMSDRWKKSIENVQEEIVKNNNTLI